MKFFTYVILIFSILSVTHVADININKLEYNYTIQVATDYEEALTEFDKNSDIEIYRNYSAHDNVTPYHYELGEGEFTGSSPKTGFNYANGFYYVNATESEVEELTHFLDDANIIYSLSYNGGYFNYEILRPQLLFLTAIILSFILLIVFCTSRNKKKIRINQIWGSSIFEIWKKQNINYFLIITSSIIGSILFILSYGYFNLFMLISLIIVTCLVLMLDYYIFLLVVKYKLTINFLLFGINMVIVSFLFLNFLAATSVVIDETKNLSVQNAIEEKFGDYYISSQCIISGSDSPPEACHDMYLEAEKQEKAYYININEDINGMEFLEVNKNMLKLLGYGEYEWYTYLVPSTMEAIPDYVTDYAIYQTNNENSMIVYIQSGVFQTPFLLDPTFEYTKYQSDVDSYSYVWNVTEYYQYSVMNYFLNIVEFFIFLVTMILLIFLSLYIYKKLYTQTRY